MGYSYDSRTGQLVCDSCGTHGGVRRVKCKYGYCPANALCAACRKNPTIKAQVREHCETNCKPAAAEFAAREAAIAALQAQGEYTFCSALSEPDGWVKVWFRGAAGDTKEAIVERGVYGLLTRTSTFASLAP